MSVDLEHIWRYLHFSESEKSVPVHPSVGALGQHMGFFGTQLGHPFFSIKWSHIQHNKNQHVKLYTLSNFTLKRKQNTFLNKH